MDIGKKVVVTTEFRGVFFGTIESISDDARTVTLSECRVCLYWSRDVAGFTGLSQVGPISNSRLGIASPKLRLYRVTSISECTEEAIQQWESK